MNGCLQLFKIENERRDKTEEKMKEKRKKLVIDEEKNIEKIWRLVKELKKTIKKVERDIGTLERKKAR